MKKLTLSIALLFGGITLFAASRARAAEASCRRLQDGVELCSRPIPHPDDSDRRRDADYFLRLPQGEKSLPYCDNVRTDYLADHNLLTCETDVQTGTSPGDYSQLYDLNGNSFGPDCMDIETTYAKEGFFLCEQEVTTGSSPGRYERLFNMKTGQETGPECRGIDMTHAKDGFFLCRQEYTTGSQPGEYESIVDLKSGHETHPHCGTHGLDLSHFIKDHIFLCKEYGGADDAVTAYDAGGHELVSCSAQFGARISVLSKGQMVCIRHPYGEQDHLDIYSTSGGPAMKELRCRHWNRIGDFVACSPGNGRLTLYQVKERSVDIVATSCRKVVQVGDSLKCTGFFRDSTLPHALVGQLGGAGTH